MAAIIVATDQNNGIGYQGQLLAHLPEDMQRFKKLTTEGGYVMMGRKTYASLPKKPLSDRINYIITSHPTENIPWDLQGQLYSINMDQAKHIIDITNETSLGNKIFIIGGGQIYKELLPSCNEIYLTKILKSYENVDTYFPKVEEKDWIKILESSGVSNGIPYQFWHYFRKS